MNYETCPVYDCCGGTIIRDNGMRAKCRNCGGRGVVEAPRVTASREPMAIHGARGTDIHEHADARSEAKRVPMSAYERGLRRGMAIARENEMPAAVVGGLVIATADWDAAQRAMEREIEEAKR